jgi:hypothetical protein
MMLTLSQQLDKVYLLIAQKKGLEEAAEFLKGFIIKYDVIKNNNKVKRGNTIQSRKSVKVL